MKRIRQEDQQHYLREKIIRNNADALVGCGITDRGEAFSEVIKTLPQIQRYVVVLIM